MARLKIAHNPYREFTYEGQDCVEFETVGKNQYHVIVDRSIWFSYLQNYSWTAIKVNSRINVKTSIDKQSTAIWRVIAEHEYDELDYWGSTIDHINNDPLDNRLCNLRLYNPILNATNIASKYTELGMQFIYRQGPADKPNGYKVHYNIGGETFYKNFSVADYGSVEAAIKAAQAYRDETVLRERKIKIEELTKKSRDIEFERGLRDKLLHGELSEIKEVLYRYGLTLEREQ